MSDTTPSPARPTLEPIPTNTEGPAAKAAEPSLAERRWKELMKEWAALDRDLLPYVGRPELPEAKRIIERQKQISDEIAELDLPPELADFVGAPGGVKDVVIVGAGLAGLSAAIYGGSEGLETLLIDASPTAGGQAALSSRIENFIGFPAGISGREFAERALDQAQRVKAKVRLGVKVLSMDYDEKTGYKRLVFDDGHTVVTKTVVLATGVQFRKLTFPGADCEGIVYGDSTQMKQLSGGDEVVIIGGGNSAGQAAIDAATAARKVTVLVRSGSLAKSMSSYLIDQLEGDPKIEVKQGEIESAIRDEQGRLCEITLKSGEKLPCRSLGLFIGSAPQVEWAGVELDERGRIVAGGDGRSELETSVPGVFTAGDGRAEAMQRTVTAVADGAEAISYVHGYLHELEVAHTKTVEQLQSPADLGAERAGIA